VKRWLRLNIVRAQDLKLHRSSPQTVLDLGCGAGSSSLSSSNWGTRVWVWISMCIPLHGAAPSLSSRTTSLDDSPYEPLPHLGRKFDLITAFSIDFNRESKREWWWGPAEWTFSGRPQRHLNPGGRIFSALTRGAMESITPLNFFHARFVEKHCLSAKLTAASRHAA
jgi:hypothetical protein